MQLVSNNPRTGLSLVGKKAHVVGGFQVQEVKAGLRLLVLRCCHGSSFVGHRSLGLRTSYILEEYCFVLFQVIPNLRLREAFKYYSADFARKGGTPQIRNPLFAEKNP